MMRLIGGIVCLFLITACQWNPINYQTPHSIVTTTTIVGDVVKELIKETPLQVKVLMAAGVDPHGYEATPLDIRSLANAELIIYTGLHLEGKMQSIFKKLNQEKELIVLSEGMPKQQLIRLNEYSYDPHVWFDVQLWTKGVKHCSQRLIQRYPAYAQIIRKNTIKYVNRLIELDQEVQTTIAKIPQKQRVLITSHDAFHYFGKAYQIKVKAIQGVSTVAEPGIRNYSKLINYMVQNQVHRVFIESSISPKTIEALIEGCAEKGLIVKKGGLLYADALGGRNSGASTYVDMIRKNCFTFSKVRFK